MDAQSPAAAPGPCGSTLISTLLFRTQPQHNSRRIAEVILRKSQVGRSRLHLIHQILDLNRPDCKMVRYRDVEPAAERRGKVVLARSQPRIARRRIESVRKPLAAEQCLRVRRESRMTPTEARSEQVLESGVVQSKPVRRACIAAAKVGHHSEIAVEII